MRFVDWFAGIGGFRLGLERAGHEHVASCELAPFPRRVYAHHWEQPTWEDVRDVDPQTIPEADLWCGGFPCFPAGVLVTTSQGETPIENVKAGDHVLTHLGNWREVLAVGQREHESPGVLVKATGCLPVIATPGHPFLAIGEDGEESWVTAASLQKGDRLLVPLPSSSEEPPHWSCPDDPGFWWVIGYWLAEGWRKRTPRSDGRSSYRITFACNREQLDRVLDWVSPFFHATVSDEGQAAIKLIVNNKGLWTFLSHFGDGAARKRIPSWIFDLPSDTQAALLAGYLFGDGCGSKDPSVSWQATTVSPGLARGVQLLGLSAEMRLPSVYISHESRETTIEGRPVRCRRTYQIRQFTRHRSTKITSRGALVAVRSVSEAPLSETVFNMEVADDNSYTASGIAVHNCQDVSVAGRGAGLLGGERSSLVFRLLGLAAVARPRWILLENTPGLLVRGRGFGRLLAVLARLGYGFAYRVLDAQYAGVAQRRERVFLLACRDPGAGRERAAEAILEPEGLLWDSPARRGERAEVAHALTTRPGSRREPSDTCVWHDRVAEPLTAHPRNYCHSGNNPRPRNVVAFDPTARWGGATDIALTLTSQGSQQPQRQVIAFDGAQVTSPHNRSRCEPGSPAYTLAATSRPHVASADGAWVRTLTPLEWERLQGFPDGWTAISGASDEARGVALGNAVAVPVVEWLGRRLPA